MITYTIYTWYPTLDTFQWNILKILKIPVTKSNGIYGEQETNTYAIVNFMHLDDPKYHAKKYLRRKFDEFKQAATDNMTIHGIKIDLFMVIHDDD